MELQQDPFVQAVTNSDEEYLNDAEKMKPEVRENGMLLRFVGTKIINDKELVLEAVRENGFALAYAGDEIRNDKEVVSKAVQNDGRALEYYAGDEIRNDEDIVNDAISQNWESWQYASEAAKTKLSSYACKSFAKSGMSTHFVPAQQRSVQNLKIIWPWL